MSVRGGVKFLGTSNIFPNFGPIPVGICQNLVYQACYLYSVGVI